MQITNRDGEVILTLDVDTLKGVDLTGTNLTNADLRGLDLTGADLRGLDLTEAKLNGINLKDACLSGAILLGAELEGANLQNADLRGADLSWTSLLDADLTGADLTGANLQEADLRKLNLEQTNLRDADLRNAYLGDAKLPNYIFHIKGLSTDVFVMHGNIRIDCQYHPIEAWDAFGEKEIAYMDKYTAAFWRTNKETIMAVAKATQVKPPETLVEHAVRVAKTQLQKLVKLPA